MKLNSDFSDPDSALDVQMYDFFVRLSSFNFYFLKKLFILYVVFLVVDFVA
ncbi:hypothetical protein OIU78_019606 [Salix suchowensis]|nr:hypothetical protein OIU78_019606 [Salix suchowensis]